MLVRNDEWIIEVGHYIIKKRIRLGRDKLTELDRAIYSFWVIDYSMRNAGSLLEALEIYPQFVDDLMDYAKTHQLEQIQFLFSQADSKAFEPTYYERFDSCCNELRKLFDN